MSFKFDNSLVAINDKVGMRRACSRLLAALACAAMLVVSPQPVAGDDAADRLFTLKVLPLLKDKCLGCHGGDADDIKGDFSVATREALLKGGESEEPAVVPGKPGHGTLIDAITWEGLEMPPKENDRLTEEQIELVRRWIADGASWPDEQTQEQIREQEAKQTVNEDGIIVATSGGTSKEWTTRRYQQADLWAFQRVKPKAEIVPAGLARDRVIDHFIDQKIKEAELVAAPKAEPRDLIRRATFDLTGLPPTPEEIDAFVQACDKDAEEAWTQLIDRLLDSPRYGERWARHWLDITRYADTGGMSNDFERSNMWRYRDYVIRSFNKDKPYNEFIVEQLAGDELADQSIRQRVEDSVEAVHKAQMEGTYNDQEAEWLVASGFLRLGPWDNAMVDTAEARQIYLDDLVNITGQTFLAQTLRCCKCHDHKFDPLPTRDYYRIYAALSTAQMAERPAPFTAEENTERFEQGRAAAQRMLDFARSEKDKLMEKQETAAKAWFKEHGLPYKTPQQRAKLPDEEKPPRHVGLDHVDQGQLKVREQDEWIWKRRLERYQPMVQSVYNSEITDLAWNGARKLRISRKPAKEPLVNHILLGGALTALGDQVFPGVLSAISLRVEPAKEVSDINDPYLLPNKTDGRRLGLAKWIANADNPLTTRAIVNRIWQHHFGRGIAANANNFGAKGAKPTHPELLDFLAGEFIDGGWSIKRMHRLIMLSDAYQRSTQPQNQERLAEFDPNNGLLSHFHRRRLTAEELRDTLLATTGELVHRDHGGGLPISPEINMEVALQPRMIQFSLAPAYQPSRTPHERNRRTIYAYHVRGQADPFTELFNQPNPNESCELRESAAVTPQVFTLLNSDIVTDRSIALARRLESEAEDAPTQINRAFRLTLGRAADDVERKQLLDYYQDMIQYHKQLKPGATTYPAQITRSLVEEFSGKPFKYTEILPVFEDYQPDTKPDAVSAETRALADVCLLLFNTNEFMYVE